MVTWREIGQSSIGFDTIRDNRRNHEYKGVESNKGIGKRKKKRRQQVTQFTSSTDPPWGVIATGVDV